MEIKVISDISKEYFENALNKLTNYILRHDDEYEELENPTDFEKGMHFAYYTMLDTVKNQLLVDGIELDTDLEKVCNTLIKP